MASPDRNLTIDHVPDKHVPDKLTAGSSASPGRPAGALSRVGRSVLSSSRSVADGGLSLSVLALDVRLDARRADDRFHPLEARQAGSGAIALHLDRLAVSVARFVETVELLVSHAEVVPYVPFDRLELDRLLQRIDRLLEALFVNERQPPIVLSERAARVQLDRFLEGNDGVLAPTHLELDATERVPGPRPLGRMEHGDLRE